MNTVLVLGAKGQLGNELKKISSEFVGIDITFTDVEELDITDLALTRNGK